VPWLWIYEVAVFFFFCFGGSLKLEGASVDIDSSGVDLMMLHKVKVEVNLTMSKKWGISASFVSFEESIAWISLMFWRFSLQVSFQAALRIGCVCGKEFKMSEMCMYYAPSLFNY
jgi:hypothetical protein